MNALDALVIAAHESWTPLTHIGMEMGKSRQYVHSALRKKNNVQCNNLAKMLDICGYALYAIPKDCDVPESALLIDE